MNLNRFAGYLLTAAAGILAGAGRVLAAEPPCLPGRIQLLAPFDGEYCLKMNSSSLFGTWLTYWAPAVQWSFYLGMALTTLWVLLGGIQIMTAGINPSGRQEGFTRMKQGVIGLPLFVFPGSILHFLNSMFFLEGPVG